MHFYLNHALGSVVAVISHKQLLIHSHFYALCALNEKYGHTNQLD